MNLKGKTILITGATGGIGSVLASHLAHEGSNLILLGRDSDKLTSLLENLDHPDHHTIYTCNLTSSTDRTELIKQIQKTHPKIDILINNAGIGIYKPSSDISPSEWKESYELNVHTPFFLSQSLTPTITIDIGSCSAVQYKEMRTLYNSTKAALRSLTLSLSLEHPGKYTHITLDSTLTPFGPLTLKEKQKRLDNGMQYLSPDWVSEKITKILQDDKRESEYCLSPHCYDECGVWKKP